MPFGDLNRDKPIGRTVEILYPAEFRSMDESAFEVVRPAVIGTAQVFGFAFGVGRDGGRVMTADVEESAQNAVLASNN